MRRDQGRHECSLQDLITMDIDQPAYRHYIDDVKSPFQILQLEKTSTTEDLAQYKDAIDRRDPDQNRKRVSSFVLENKGDGRHNEISGDREGSRTKSRKKIFAEKNKQKQGFWPSFFSVIGELVGQKSVSPVPPLQKNQVKYSPPSPTSRVFPPISNLSPIPIIQQSIFYNNPELPQHQQQFTTFILSVLPKLFLKSTIAAKIYAEKSEVLQAMLGRLQSQEKYKVLLSMFGSENVKRIDRRMKSENVEQFLEELMNMSRRPIKEDQKKKILRDMEKMMEILAQVQNDIRSYLSSANRVPELEHIYDSFLDINPRPLSKSTINSELINQLEAYLNYRDIRCNDKQLRPLSYLWRNMEHKFYTKKQFVEELTRNDYIMRDQEKDKEDLVEELKRLGYRRNQV